VTAGTAPVPVVCAVIERAGRFLAAQRAAHESNALLWEFPGGKIQKDETAQEALARELREELGIDVSILAAGAPQVYSYPHITIELIPFVCTLVHGEPHAHEHAAIAWVTPEEAKDLPWAPADVPVLEDYIKRK
jgi:8-oxo-dGTP diphosphatase